MFKIDFHHLNTFSDVCLVGQSLMILSIFYVFTSLLHIFVNWQKPFSPHHRPDFPFNFSPHGIIVKTKFVKFCQKFMKNLVFSYFFFEKKFYFKLGFWKFMISCTCFFAKYACENDFVTDWKSSIQCIKRKKVMKKLYFFVFKKHEIQL